MPTPSRRIRCKISLDGKMTMTAEGYEGPACSLDIERYLALSRGPVERVATSEATLTQEQQVLEG